MENTTWNKRVILLGGGTGGHIFPLISLQKELKKLPGFSPVFMGERGDSMERKIAEKEWIPFIWITSWKFRRYFSLRTFFVPILIGFGFFQSLFEFVRHRPVFVFSKGGYVSLPAAIAAWILRIPVYLHESDSVPGLANRWVGKFSKKVFLGFEEAAKFFPENRTQAVGQILSKEVCLAPYTGEPIFQTTGAEKPNLLIVCGSLGSARVFDAVLACDSEVLSHFNIVVTLGTLNTSFRSKFEEKGIVTYDFFSPPEIMQAYRESDIAITRAGATTLGELELFGPKMIIIPLEWSAGDHQKVNASIYQKCGHQVILEQDISLELSQTLAINTTYKKKPGVTQASFGIEKILLEICKTTV